MIKRYEITVIANLDDKPNFIYLSHEGEAGAGGKNKLLEFSDPKELNRELVNFMALINFNLGEKNED